jgi:hypothetical protein
MRQRYTVRFSFETFPFRNYQWPRMTLITERSPEMPQVDAVPLDAVPSSPAPTGSSPGPPATSLARR